MEEEEEECQTASPHDESLEQQQQQQQQLYYQCGDTAVDPSSSSSSSSSCVLCPSAADLPLRPPAAIHCNFAHFFAVDFLKERHDQYIYRHCNGLCVIGLAPTHIALQSQSPITAVDFNVGKQSRADMRATGKRKNNAYKLEPNSALCKVLSGDTDYIVRCCVKGALLEVNERLIKQPSLLNSHAATEGYIAILMPKPDDWKEAQKTFLCLDKYRDCKGLHEKQ